MKRLIFSLLLSVLTLGAAELSGKWSGSFDVTNSSGETKAETAYMNLTEHTGEVAGTAGPSVEQQWPIRKGKLDGERLKFEILREDGGVLVFDLTFDGQSIRGTCAGTGNGGEKMSAKLRLKRVSD